MTSELNKFQNEGAYIGERNKQLLENQSSLCLENKKLQEDVTKLSKHILELRNSSVDPKQFNKLVFEKNHLTTLNESLKTKIKHLESAAPNLSIDETEHQNIEKQEIKRSIEELDIILTKINNRPKTFEIFIPEESLVNDTTESLKKRLDDEQRRSDEAVETIRKLRNDEEKLILREKLSEMKHLITNFEIEKTKLKFEIEQLKDDIVRNQKETDEVRDDLKAAKKESYQLEDEKDKLKQIIAELESEKIKLKKDMIEELTEANRAKRILTDTEIALQHISEAYENKRQEVREYQIQLEESQNLIMKLKAQFENSNGDDPHY